MHRFVITIEPEPGARDRILARVPRVRTATRAEPGCPACDFFTCTDAPDRLVFIKAWKDQAAHAFHMEQEHTGRFIAFHEPFHRSPIFETINPAD